jgi:hypothetical protein
VARNDKDDQLIKEAFDKLVSAESMQVDTELVLNLPKKMGSKERPFTQVTSRVSGDFIGQAEGAPELTGRFYVEGKGRGNVFFADGELRIFQEDVMFNLDELPVFFNPSGSLVQKWTRVETSLLPINNKEEVGGVMGELFLRLEYVGEEQVEGKAWVHFKGRADEEWEDRAEQVLNKEVSNNLALDVIARLLESNDIKDLDVWVSRDDKEIRKIEALFVRPLPNGNMFDFARLKVSLADYGKEAVVERPESKLRVDADVFGRLFGRGEVVEVGSEMNLEGGN